MHQKSLIPEIKPLDENTKMIGANLSLVFNKKDKNLVILKKSGVVIKKVDLSDKPSKKLLIIEAVELGATKYKLAEALNVSRQTIHNYIECKKRFGTEGLLGGYNPDMGKNLEEHRKRTQKNRIQGNKAEILAEERKAERIENESKQLKLDFEFGSKEIPEEEMPFNELHDWQETRYAGIFLYLIVLIFKNQWVKLIMGHFGTAYKIFFVFLLMVARNVRSIESLKNVNYKEAGIILGFKKIPGVKGVWKWFYSACNLRRSASLCKTFFRNQICCGLVNVFIWFADGHLLPYSGKKKIHPGYYTQRKMMVPGQTNQVTCDITGRIVDFEIQEGKGDLKSHILDLKQKWEEELGEIPIMVFDRECYGGEFFNNMINNQIPFVAWEKNINSKKLEEINDEKYTEEFELNGKKYKVFEGEKDFIIEENKIKKTIKLRRIYIWNISSNRRTCCLSWDAKKGLSTVQCAEAILSRWGASENTFKHIKDRHPFHYHPGFKTQKSEKQLISNPKIKEIEKEVKVVNNQINKKHKENSKASETLNKDGSRRENSKKTRLESEIKKLEENYQELLEKKKELPEKVDVSSLEDYRSFNKIDNEGKNLFDFVTASVWNARKELTDWLLCHYPNKNEYVDLFYAITECHGWVKSESERVIVRLEPLQQAARRKAQEQLCKRLNALGAQLPTGKLLQIEVGTAP
ncbi:transposase [Candidatus Magnetomorum sp. HK-1]|nr:transposase [Candidatus Magnetomorum sp. HK-1]